MLDPDMYVSAPFPIYLLFLHDQSIVHRSAGLIALRYAHMINQVLVVADTLQVTYMVSFII